MKAKRSNPFVNKNISKLAQKLSGFIPFGLSILFAYFAADLLILNYRDQMLPNQAPPAKPPKYSRDSGTTRSAFNTITDRNIFSSDGKIPESQASLSVGKKKEIEEKPVLSSLPLNLAGTIVHSNPEKSVANIELKNKNQVLSFRPGNDIDKIAILTKVERYRAYFRNTNNQRIEYIEMKSAEGKLNFTGAKSAFSVGDPEIKSVGNNKFEILRSDLNKYTNDLGSVLMQAAMQPKRKANGDVECFKFLSIQSGSIFSKLGFQVGDCLKSVNGEPVDSPQKGMEMFQTLKNANSVKITVERDGSDHENDYSIK